MQGKRTLILILLIVEILQGIAQQHIIHQKMIWSGYYGKFDLSPTLAGTLELDERMRIDPVAQQSMVLPRIALVKQLKGGWAVGGGVTYYLNYSITDSIKNTNLTVPELRLHQQIEYTHLFRKLVFNHRYKLEERWIRKKNRDALADGYNFNFRARYKFQISFPVFMRSDAESKYHIKSSNEILLNFGNKSVPLFDQNRFYLAFNYQIVKGLQIEAGYLKVFKQISIANNFTNSDCLRVTIFQNLALFK